MADLPLDVSADSILDALHRSYEDILQSLELSSSSPSSAPGWPICALNYRQRISPNYAAPPPEVDWMSDIVAR